MTLYSIAKPKLGGGHTYHAADGTLVGLPKYATSKGKLLETFAEAVRLSSHDPESDGVGSAEADSDDWHFISIAKSTRRSGRSIEPVETISDASPQFAVFSPFTESVKPEVHFPDALPEPLGSYCKAASQSYQVDVAMPSCCVLSVLSAIFQRGGYSVRVSPDWQEAVNLFFLITAPPSERKSPVLRDAQKPLTDSMDSWNMKNQESIDWKRKRVEVLRKKVDNGTVAVAKGDKKYTEETLRIAQQELREAEEELMHPLEFLVDDCTPEAMGMALRDNDEAIALLTGEGGSVLANISGRYSSGHANLDLMLKAYTVEPTVIHRVGRQNISLKNPRLTVLLMAQPSLTADFIGNDSFSGRGLCARFLYSFPESQVGKRAFRTEPIPEDVRRNYESLIRELADFVFDWDIDDPTLTLSDEALAELESYHTQVEPDRANMEDILQAWSGKAEGNIVRIAALLYLAQHHGQPGVIDGDTMKSAVKIGWYFTQSAEIAFQAFRETKAEQDARHILRKLLSDGFKQYRKDLSLTKNELFTRLRCSRFPSVESLHQGLKELQERGYIAQEYVRTGGKGRPSPTIFLNPEVFG